VAMMSGDYRKSGDRAVQGLHSGQVESVRTRNAHLFGARSRLLRSLGRRGVLGTVGHLLFRPFMRPAESSLVAFGEEHRVDLGDRINMWELGIENPNCEFGTCYEGIPPETFHEAVSAAGVRHDEFTFIDVGSGKGAALLFASDYPFARIIGIELSPILSQIAEENIRRYQNPRQRCTALDSICADALEYSLPIAPTVFYFFNPFDEPVMEAFLARVVRSFESQPRDIYLIYQTPLVDHLFDRHPAVTRLRKRKARAWEGLTAEFGIFRISPDTDRHRRASGTLRKNR
jgi:hypothetical protein